jgi:hypothetical protein
MIYRYSRENKNVDDFSDGWRARASTDVESLRRAQTTPTFL